MIISIASTLSRDTFLLALSQALELHRGRHVSSTSGDGKVVKVMVRIGGGWCVSFLPLVFSFVLC